MLFLGERLGGSLRLESLLKLTLREPSVAVGVSGPQQTREQSSVIAGEFLRGELAVAVPIELPKHSLGIQSSRLPRCRLGRQRRSPEQQSECDESENTHNWRPWGPLGSENRVPVGRTDYPLYQTTVSPQSFALQCQQCMFCGSTTAVDRGKMLAYDPHAGNFVVEKPAAEQGPRGERIRI